MDNEKISSALWSTESAKAAKASGFGYLNAIHYMSPSSFAGVGNLCPWSTKACEAICLGYHTGQASMVKDSHLVSSKNSVRLSRDRKAWQFMNRRPAYLKALDAQIHKLKRKAKREGLKLSLRFNGSTDIVGSARKVAEDHPEIPVNEYTKSLRFALDNAMGKHPANLTVCFSRNEVNEAQCEMVLAAGGLVSVVFGGEIPATWRGFPVVDGDKHDLLHLQPKGSVLALKAKGAARKDRTSGFVVW